MRPLFVIYTYTDEELKKALKTSGWPPYISYFISIGVFLSSMIMLFNALAAINDLFSRIVFIIVAIALLLVAVDIWIAGPKQEKKLRSMFAQEQTIELSNGQLIWTRGADILSMDVKYIYKIVQTDCFFRLHLYLVRGDAYAGRTGIIPQIPVRCVSEDQMRRLAEDLKIPY
ncbi:MAG: hypothetical protein FWF49_06055 [Oscillospiraceae bacterium]|nr:hypothetical protein [Oscillospiraceae bacterium]